MTNPSTPRTRSGRAAVAALCLALAACGGGGGADTSPPPPAGSQLGPSASSVASSDGKVSLAVGDNALQAPVTVSIAPAQPDAETAADPAYVAGTTYTFTAPDIAVPEQVLISIESSAATGSSGGGGGFGGWLAGRARALAGADGDRRGALALPPGTQPPPTCLVNSPLVLNGTLQAQNILVTSFPNPAQCPQSPAPGCLEVFNPNPNVLVCSPNQDVIVVPSVADACPAGYREVTGQAEFQALALANGWGRVCQRNGDATPPVMRGADGRVLANCTPSAGRFLCLAPRLPSGTYSVRWDKTAPPDPSFSAKSTAAGTFVYRDELETGAVFNTRIIATDPHGLGMAEILEVFDPAGGNVALGRLRTERVWRAPAADFSGAAVKNYDSGVVQLPFGNGPAGKRRFMARVFDKAGNSALSEIRALDFFIGTVEVVSFTAQPASVQFPGGPVTLSWGVKGATTVSIDNGGGSVTLADNVFNVSTGSVTVNVTGTTTFTLTASHPNRNTKTATVTVTLSADATPPVVSIAASPATVVAPGSTMLSATASDNAGVSHVEFYRGATLIGTDTSAPFTQAVSFTPADIGTVVFTAKAFDAAGNSSTSTPLNLVVAADAAPPTVSLAASPATVVAPGTTSLEATASDNIGVTRVEFFRGSTLIATDTAAPFQASVGFTTADVGTQTFTAKAYDAQNNVATSLAVNVLVTVPTPGDTYASPSGVDTGNSTCAQASPCRTIAKAAATAQAGATVWLADGDYSVATQPSPIAIPAGLTLRALTPGQAAVGQTIVLQGNATLVGVALRRFGFGDSGSIEASSGSVLVEGLTVLGAVSAPSGFNWPLMLSGTVHLTMTPGNVSDYTSQLSAVGQASATFAQLSGSARLSITGGTFGGAALGGSDGVTGSYGRGAFVLTGASRLDLTNVTVGVDAAGVAMMGTATQLFMNGATLVANANSGAGAGIHAALGTPQISLVNSTISGFRYDYAAASTGIRVGAFAQPGAVASITLQGSSISGNNEGVWVDDASSTPSSMTFTGSATVSGNTHAGIVCRDACVVDLAGGAVSGNGSGTTALSSDFLGGIWMGLPSKTYQLKLRNVQVIDNRSSAGGNANALSNSGFTIVGNAASTWDLGTAASPGGNTIRGNTSSAQTTGLHVNVAAGLTVLAVGNSFAVGQQGANANGQYQLGTAPCGASSCNVTSGAGTNYRISSGTLRLAQ